MKRLFAACLTVALAATMFVGDAEARRRGRTEIIQTAPAVDINTLLMLGALGGQSAFGGGAGLLPLLLGATASPQTVIIEERGRRRGNRVRRAPSLRRN